YAQLEGRKIRRGIEVLLPVAVTYEGNRTSPRTLVFRSKAAADPRRYAHEGEEITGYGSHHQSPGLAGSGYRLQAAAHLRQPMQRAALRPQVLEVRIGKVQPISFAGLLPDPHQLLGAVIRQRAQQHTIHDAEDRRSRADAQRQGEHGDQAESRAAAQNAQAIANVLKQSAHPISSPDLSRHFLGQAYVALCAPGGIAGPARALPPRHPVLRRHAQVTLNFVVEFLLAFATVKEAHALPSSADGLRMPAIAARNCCQRERS